LKYFLSLISAQSSHAEFYNRNYLLHFILIM